MSIIIFDGMIYASVLAVLCVGLTLTYKITSVPNFAHMSFAILGMYIALIMARIFEMSVYLALPIAFVASGALSLFMYYGIIRILQKKKSSIIAMIIATLAFDIFMIGVLNIIADGLRNSYQVHSRDFTLRSLDIVIGQDGSDTGLMSGTGGLPMVFVAAVAILAGLGLGLYYLLYKTSFGMSMRGAIENETLAQTLGINTNMIFCFAWFLSGGLAGLAGVLMAMWFQGDPSLAAIMLPSIFAGSIVGGFASIYGAILGGLLVGMSEVVGTSVLVDILGYWIIPYRPIIPFIAMIITLLVLPGGLIQIITKYTRRKGGPTRQRTEDKSDDGDDSQAGSTDNQDPPKKQDALSDTDVRKRENGP